MSNANQVTVPEGYVKDSQGRLVPLDMIKPQDILRNDLVVSLTEMALEHAGKTQVLRDNAMAAIDKYIAKAFKRFGTEVGGKKGNLTLNSYDGSQRIVINVGHDISFNENLNIAKKLIDECLTEWSKDSRSELRVLIDQAFQTSDDGSLSTSRILGLRTLKIKDLTWKRAMRALNDAIETGTSKPYLRFYVRDDSGEFKQVALDMSKLAAMEVAQ